MKITSGSVVTFHYRLSNGDSELENSQGGDPMAYLHGHGNIISGLEAALNGKEAGEEFSVTVPPEEGYGLRKEDAVQRVPIKHLHDANKIKNKLKPGMLVNVNTQEGAKQATVVKAGRFNVDLDTNHPLAGLTLTFDLTIESVREATAEEISHGHAHGIGGHQH